MASLSQTTFLQVPLLVQPKSQVASWLQRTSSQVMPPPLQFRLHSVPILHSAPLQLAPVQFVPSRQSAASRPSLQPLQRFTRVITDSTAFAVHAA